MANKVINILDTVNVENYFNEYIILLNEFTTKEFKEFFGNKCIEVLKELSESLLSDISYSDVATEEIEKYKNAHQVEIGDDYVLLFNETMADLSHLSPLTSAHYPNGLSIAKLIEYGMGIKGTTQDDWQTQMNPNRDYTKAWAYRRPAGGTLYWSNGMEGKFIYQKLIEVVKEKMHEWVNEYYWEGVSNKL